MKGKNLYIGTALAVIGVIISLIFFSTDMIIIKFVAPVLEAIGIYFTVKHQIKPDGIDKKLSAESRRLQ